MPRRVKSKPPAEAPTDPAAILGDSSPRRIPIPPEDFLSTGCTLTNLAFTGHPDRGVPKGHYWYVVGATGSSKTWATFCLFAEAARNPHFKQYRFIHDNAENGALMDVETYFGKDTLKRLEAPSPAGSSSTVQEFYYNLELNCRKKTPCIYALDSMDALNDDADDAVFEAQLKVHQGKDAKVPGSMGMQKAKTNSKNINRVVRSLKESGSILVVIGQLRDKFGGTIPGQKTDGGGHALKFYAHLRTWHTVVGPITNRYNKKDREVGAYIRCDVQKNRVNGWEGKFDYRFLKGHGVDDAGSLVDYLVEENYWDVSDGELTAPEFGFTGKPDTLVRHVQDHDKEPLLRDITARVWNDVVANALPKRKPRYT